MCVRTAVGNYVITPDTAFPDTTYIVNLECQLGNNYAVARLNTNALSTSDFTIITYATNVVADCNFHCTVLA